MRRKTRRLTFSVAVAAALSSLSIASAAAAPPTPVTCGSQITAPGQYFLAGDCTGPGIRIQVSDVHLRLSGHTMQGTDTETAIGITVGPGASNVRVQGPGAITGYRLGVLLDQAVDSSVERVTSTGNGEAGFMVDRGSSNRIIQVNGSNNFDYGMKISGGATNARVVGGTFDENATAGIWLDNASGNAIVANQTRTNGTLGIWLFQATGNKLHANTALGNGGFDLADFSPDCDDNDWEGNRFNTSDQPCID